MEVILKASHRQEMPNSGPKESTKAPCARTPSDPAPARARASPQEGEVEEAHGVRPDEEDDLCRWSAGFLRSFHQGHRYEGERERYTTSSWLLAIYIYIYTHTHYRNQRTLRTVYAS